jgi:hypothetical protein
MPVLSVMNMPTPLLKSATPYSDIADTSIRIAGPERKKSFYNIHWLTKEDTENQTQTHNHTHTRNMAHSPPPKHWYLPITVTPFKHACIFSINWEMPKLKRITMLYYQTHKGRHCQWSH